MLYISKLKEMFQGKMNKLSRLGTQILDFVLPLRCPISGELVDHKGGISPKVWAGLSFIEKPFCAACGIPFSFSDDPIENQQNLRCNRCLDKKPYYDQARSALTYNDTSRGLILKFKHGDQLHLSHSFMPFLLKAGTELIKKTDLILPVPLHRLRLLKRRYNQAALIAKDLAKKTDIAYRPDILVRAKHTPQQTGKMGARFRNVSGAFIVPDREQVKGKKILLIDDVYTTGATVNACAKALKKAGAKAVYVLCIARVCES